MTTRLAGIATLLAAMTSAACGMTAEEHFAKAEAYARQDKHAEAVVEYRRALQEDEGFGRAQYRLAESYERIGDLRNAARAYVRAAELLPNDVEAQLKGSSMLLLSQRFDEARSRAEMARRLDPGNVRALLLQAHALAGMKRTGPALDRIREAIALDPTRADTYADLAMFQFSTGSFEQGEANLQRAADAQPPSGVAQLALASLYWAQGRLDEAEARFKRAAEVAGPTDDRPNRALATFYLANNRPEAAEAHLAAMAERTRSVPARLALADFFVVAGRLPDATRVLEMVAADPDGYADANSRLAALAYAAKRRADAHRIIDETLKRKPNAARAILTRANFLLIERRLGEAETMLKAAVRADPGSIPVRFALGRFYSAAQNPTGAAAEFTEVLRLDPESVPAMMELARLNMATGRTDAATSFAQQAVDARPGLDSSLLLARTLVSSGQLSRAETVLRPYLTSGRSDLLALAGGVYVGIGDETRGLQLLEQAATAAPDDPEPLEALVTMDLRAGNAARAKARVDQRLAIRPNDSRTLVLAARAYGGSGDKARMHALLTRAIEIDSSNTTAFALLGQLLASEGKLADALRQYERLVSRDPRSVPANIMVAFLLEGLGRKAEAEKQYERVLEIDPRAPIAANNLAWLIAERRGNLDIALQLAQTAKEALPESADVNDTLAWIYYLKDLPDLALPPLRLAIERDPQNAIYHHHSGLAHLKSGDLDSARMAFETALKLNPSFNGASEAREALSRLR